ncbi:ATP-dependent nuclease [Myceligenerans xiligouense]|uniref:ATP-dependent nuclease n=1 Tax=Myceligenerans xiligouense TaxID=253184 RepID=UPI00147756D9|nr:ATP-binding protein [Myceligenerans xiligouense]
MTEVTLTTSDQSFKPSAHVTLIVGPNNVGKSAVLEGIRREISSHPSSRPNNLPGPIARVSVEMPAYNEFADRIKERTRFYEAGTRHDRKSFHANTFLLPDGDEVSDTQMQDACKQNDHFGQIASVLVTHLKAEGRGGVLASRDVPDLTGTQEQLMPIQKLFEDRRLESTLSGYMERAFNTPLLVNRHAGRKVHIHIGSVDVEEQRIGESHEYLRELLKLPYLARQGAGMQAFMGTILTLSTDIRDIVLLDEPETFLHPPQARLLGQIIAEISANDGPQVIVATHSNDFVRGVVDAAKVAADVSVVRVTRPTDAENNVAQVHPDSIKDLYKDPLMRYSHILDGIFYKGVVLCEAESDCTYYSAVLGAMEGSDGLPSSDLLFTHCGGKNRLRRAYAALDAAAVPTAVIADIDLLSNRDEFKRLFEAMGGTFTDIEGRYNVLSSSIRDGKVEATRDHVRDSIAEIIEKSGAKTLSRQEVEQIVAVVKPESGWKQVKKKGHGAINRGDPMDAFGDILGASRRIGLFILPVGELESFHSKIGGNKQVWLQHVLEHELFAKESEAWSLIRDVRAFVSESQ